MFVSDISNISNVFFVSNISDILFVSNISNNSNISNIFIVSDKCIVCAFGSFPVEIFIHRKKPS